MSEKRSPFHSLSRENSESRSNSRTRPHPEYPTLLYQSPHRDEFDERLSGKYAAHPVEFRGTMQFVRAEHEVEDLHDEQKEIQKKAFTKWMNSHLMHHPNSELIEDLFEDICDGVRLINLLEVLTGERLPCVRPRFPSRVLSLNNIQCALSILEEQHVKLVNINANDIVDSRPVVVLGLIWAIIMYFQIYYDVLDIRSQISASTPISFASGSARSFDGGSVASWRSNTRIPGYSYSHNRAMSPSMSMSPSRRYAPRALSSPMSKRMKSASNYGAETPSSTHKSPTRRSRGRGGSVIGGRPYRDSNEKRVRKTSAVSKILLKWCQKMISHSHNAQLTDFSHSWKDGKALLALIHALEPDELSASEMRSYFEPPYTDEQRIQLALSLADEKLGISKLLDSSDFKANKLDERSIMTYVAQFLRYHLNKKNRVDGDADRAKRKKYDRNIPYISQSEMELTIKSLQSGVLSADESRWLYLHLRKYCDETLPSTKHEIEQSLTPKQKKLSRADSMKKFNNFAKDLNEQNQIYKALADQHARPNTVSRVRRAISQDELSDLFNDFTELQNLKKLWHSQLDEDAPSKLKKLVEKTNQLENACDGEGLAEVMIGMSEAELGSPRSGEITSQTDENLKQTNERLNKIETLMMETNDLLSDIEKMKKSSSEESLPELEYLENRLNSVKENLISTQANDSCMQATYLLDKLMHDADARLYQWNLLLESEPDNERQVRAIMDSYYEYVVTGKLFEKYDQLYAQLLASKEKLKNSKQKIVSSPTSSSGASTATLVRVNGRWRRICHEANTLRLKLEKGITWLEQKKVLQKHGKPMTSMFAPEDKDYTQLTRTKHSLFMEDDEMGISKQRTKESFKPLPYPATADEIHESVHTRLQKYSNFSEEFYFELRQVRLQSKQIREWHANSKQRYRFLRRVMRIVRAMVPSEDVWRIIRN